MEKDNYSIEPVERLLKMLETVILARNLERQHHRDEFEKHFSYLLQGKDMLDVYERRKAGVSDEDWEKAIKDFRLCLNLDQQ